MPRPRFTRQLEALSRPLRPARSPWYVRSSQLPASLQRYFPADGWYWIPAGNNVAVFLARSFGQAEHEIRAQLERQEQQEILTG